MTFDQDTPLSRIPNETIKAHTALMDYYLMGDGRRSFGKLLDQWARIRNVPGSYPDEQPTKRLQTLKDWSSKYHWQARIAQQNGNDNSVILKQIEAERAAIAEQYRERHMSEAEALALLSDIARSDMGEFAKVRSQADLEEHPHASLVKHITQHYTQTERGEGDEKKTEIKARIILGLYDKLKALEMILRHYGSFDADNKSEITMKLEDSPLETIRSRLDSIAANTAAAVDPERPD